MKDTNPTSAATLTEEQQSEERQPLLAGEGGGLENSEELKRAAVINAARRHEQNGQTQQYTVSENIAWHVRNIETALHWVANIQQAMFSFICGMFTKASFAAVVLASLAAPVLFAMAATLEVIDFGLNLAKAILTKDFSREQIFKLAFSFAKTALVTTAVVGSIAFKHIFALKPILGLVGGLTPFLFTIAMGITAVVSLGYAAYNAYKWHKETDPDKRAEYKQKTKEHAINATIAIIATVAVAALMLNPVTAPAGVAVAVIASIAFAGHLAWRNREKIKSGAKSLWRAISNKFKRSPSTSTVKENGLDNHPATGERASSPRIPATLFQPQEEHGQGQQDPATHSRRSSTSSLVGPFFHQQQEAVVTIQSSDTTGLIPV